MPLEVFYEKEIIYFDFEKINIAKEDLLERLCSEINQLNEKYERIQEENIKLRTELDEIKLKYDTYNKEIIFKEKYPIFDTEKQ